MRFPFLGLRTSALPQPLPRWPCARLYGPSLSADPLCSEQGLDPAVLGQGETFAQRWPAVTWAECARVSEGANGQPDAAPCALHDASPPPRRRPGPGQGRPSPYRASSGPWTAGPGRSAQQPPGRRRSQKRRAARAYRTPTAGSTPTAG